MEQIKLYFKKFEGLTIPHADLRAALQLAIQKRFGVVIDEKDIRVQEWTIYLTARPALKSELFIHREAGLADVEEILERENKRGSV